MRALILAAGYATRLYPLTKEYPKSLLTVKHRPIVDFIIDKLKVVDDIGEIIVVTNSKFILKFKRWRRKQSIRGRISLVDDLTRDNATRRGAIGDLDFVIRKKRLRDDLLVIGGDNLFDGDLNEFLLFSRKHKGSPAIGVYDIRDKAQATHYGVIQVDKKNKIINFWEKPAKPRTSLVAMCLYYFPKERLGLSQEYIKNRIKKTDAIGMYIDWLSRKVSVYAYIFGGRWYDIGDHKFYNRAKEKFSA